MIVDQNYIQETLGIIFYLKLIYMKQIGEINWSPIPKDSPLAVNPFGGATVASGMLWAGADATA